MLAVLTLILSVHTKVLMLSIGIGKLRPCHDISQSFLPSPLYNYFTHQFHKILLPLDDLV